MGSLILLLLVMTRKIRNDQVEQADQAAQMARFQERPDRTPEIQMLDAEIDSLRNQLIVLQSDSTELKAAIAVDEQRKLELLRRLSQLQAALDMARSSPADSQVADSVRTVRDLTQQEKELVSGLEAIEKALLEKRSRLHTISLEKERASVVLSEKQSALLSLRKSLQQAEAAPPTSGVVTMLEFTNPTGTARTPIVIEVTEKGYEFRPSGVLITPSELDNFPMRDNPLLSGVLTAHRYRAGASVIDEPYVLLLVRPDGCLPFYRAQRILSDSKVHFGYELVGAERQIAVGEPDTREAEKTRQAIAEALQRREKIYGRLIEIMKQERGELAEQGAGEGGKAGRRLVVRPDGRVLADDGAVPRALDGRFYAGGEAPPSTYLQKRPVAGFRNKANGELSADEAEKMVEKLAEQYAEEQREAAASSGRMLADNDEDPIGEGQKTPVSSLGESMHQPSVLAARPPAVPMEEPASPVMGTQSFEEFLSGREQPISGVETSQVAPSTEDEGVGTFQGDRFLQSRANSESEVKPYSLLTRRELEQENSSHTVAAADGHASAPTGSPGSSSSVDDIIAASGKMPDLSKIDPDLLKRLEAGKGQSGSSLATPIGVTVYIDEQHMTVGQLPSVPIDDDSVAPAFRTLIQGVDQEVRDQQLKPDEPVMPIVKFIVSPGGERWRLRLMPMLRHLGLRSATVYEITPYVTLLEETDTTGRASLDSDSVEGH
ncbi:MAG: hypothetical protein ACK58L_01565 [Planctomycetota bacterium]